MIHWEFLFVACVNADTFFYTDSAQKTNLFQVALLKMICNSHSVSSQRITTIFSERIILQNDPFGSSSSAMRNMEYHVKVFFYFMIALYFLQILLNVLAHLHYKKLFVLYFSIQRFKGLNICSFINICKFVVVTLQHVYHFKLAEYFMQVCFGGWG